MDPFSEATTRTPAVSSGSGSVISKYSANDHDQGHSQYRRLLSEQRLELFFGEADRDQKYSDGHKAEQPLRLRKRVAMPHRMPVQKTLRRVLPLRRTRAAIRTI